MGVITESTFVVVLCFFGLIIISGLYYIVMISLGLSEVFGIQNSKYF